MNPDALTAPTISILGAKRQHLLLVHEFSPPGLGLDIMCAGGAEPCYHGINVNGHHKWALAYPTELFLRLARSAVENFVAKLRRDGRNPYDDLIFETQW